VPVYFAFSDIHWCKIRPISQRERIMRDIRRRTRLLDAFPRGDPRLNSAAARMRHIVGTQ
jgi:hypothetical protein